MGRGTLKRIAQESAEKGDGGSMTIGSQAPIGSPAAGITPASSGAAGSGGGGEEDGEANGKLLTIIGSGGGGLISIMATISWGTESSISNGRRGEGEGLIYCPRSRSHVSLNSALGCHATLTDTDVIYHINLLMVQPNMPHFQK